MLQMSTAGPYFWLLNISGAVYAGEPHCVIREESPQNTLLNPKSTNKIKNVKRYNCIQRVVVDAFIVYFNAKNN